MKMGIRAALAAMTLVATCTAVAHDDRANEAVSSLQGSWTSSIVPQNCASGAAVAPPLKGLSTFHQGGTLTESREGPPGTARGPGHGIWYRTGKRTFNVKIVFQRFDLNGFLIGTQEILSANTVSKDSKSAKVAATFRILDNNGVTLATGCAAGESQRIQY